MNILHNKIQSESTALLLSIARGHELRNFLTLQENLSLRKVENERGEEANVRSKNKFVPH